MSAASDERQLAAPSSSGGARDPLACARERAKRLRAALGGREQAAYPDWAGLPEGLLLQMFEIMTHLQDGRQLVCVAGRVCRSWRLFALEVLLRDTAISRPKRFCPARPAPAATSTLATQAACVCNADAVSTGVSSGEAISSKQKRPTGSRHDSESAPPAGALRARHRSGRGEGAGPSRPAREADSGPAPRSRHRGAARVEREEAEEEEPSAGGGGGAAGGAGPSLDAAGGAAAPPRRRARDAGNASDMAVVFSPAGGVVTGIESEEDGEEEDAVEQRVPAHHAEGWRVRVRMLADDAIANVTALMRGGARPRDASSGGGSAAR